MGCWIRSYKWWTDMFTAESICSKWRWFRLRRLPLFECSCSAQGNFAPTHTNWSTVTYSWNWPSILFIIVWRRENKFACFGSFPWRWIHVRIGLCVSTTAFSRPWCNSSYGQLSFGSTWIFKYWRWELSWELRWVNQNYRDHEYFEFFFNSIERFERSSTCTEMGSWEYKTIRRWSREVRVN